MKIFFKVFLILFFALTLIVYLLVRYSNTESRFFINSSGLYKVTCYETGYYFELDDFLYVRVMQGSRPPSNCHTTILVTKYGFNSKLINKKEYDCGNAKGVSCFYPKVLMLEDFLLVCAFPNPILFDKIANKSEDFPISSMFVSIKCSP